jgi:polar amino acid transport system substrate-binding protein
LYYRIFIAITATLVMNSLVQAKTIRLVTLEYPPYEYTQDGQLEGLAVDVIRRTFKEMNQPITIEVLPWARAMRYIKEGSRDAVFTAFKTPERERFADFSNQVLMQQAVSLFVRRDSKIAFDGDLRELDTYSLGVVRKISYGLKLDNAIKTDTFKRVEEANEGTQNFGLLLKKRVDMVASTKYGGYHILKKLDRESDVKELPISVQNLPSYIAFSKERKLTQLRDEFDKTLARLKQSGEYQKIIDDYFARQL